MFAFFPLKTKWHSSLGFWTNTSKRQFSTSSNYFSCSSCFPRLNGGYWGDRGEMTQAPKHARIKILLGSKLQIRRARRPCRSRRNDLSWKIPLTCWSYDEALSCGTDEVFYQQKLLCLWSFASWSCRSQCIFFSNRFFVLFFRIFKNFGLASSFN